MVAAAKRAAQVSAAVSLQSRFAGNGAGSVAGCSFGFAGGFGPLAEHRCVVAPWDFDDDRFGRPFAAEVLVEALAQHRGVDAHNIIGGGVVVGGAAEHLMAYLLLVDLDRFVVKDPAGQVNQ